MKINNIVLSCMLPLSLIACGGGGGSDSSAPAAPDTSQTEPEETPVEPVVEVNTVDVVASEDFLVKSTAELTLSIEIADLRFERAYLNLCHQTDSAEIDYNNCIVKTPLKNGMFEKTITIGHDVDQLELQVWRYDPTAEPYTYVWVRDGEASMNWSVGS